MKEQIEIKVNGVAERLTAGMTLMGLIEHFDLPHAGCVFSINNVVVPRSVWSETTLNQGDTISLFQAFAGG